MTINELYQLIDDDSLASSFQSLAQYRAYLREQLKKTDNKNIINDIKNNCSSWDAKFDMRGCSPYFTNGYGVLEFEATFYDLSVCKRIVNDLRDELKNADKKQ